MSGEAITYSPAKWFDPPTFAGFRGVSLSLLAMLLVLTSTDGLVSVAARNNESPTHGWQYHGHIFLRMGRGGTEPLTHCRAEYRWVLDTTPRKTSMPETVWLDDSECDLEDADAEWHTVEEGRIYYAYWVSGQSVYPTYLFCGAGPARCEVRVIPQHIS